MMKTDKLLNDAVNEAVKEKPTVTQRIEDLVGDVSQRFIEKKLDAFPYYCQVFIMQNKMRMNQEELDGTKGWSEKKDFKMDYEIPTDLYYFMINMVYRKFWKEDNEKVWRRFLNSLMKGYDPIECLMKVKSIYGTSETAKKAGII